MRSHSIWVTGRPPPGHAPLFASTQKLRLEVVERPSIQYAATDNDGSGPA